MKISGFPFLSDHCPYRRLRGIRVPIAVGWIVGVSIKMACINMAPSSPAYVSAQIPKTLAPTTSFRRRTYACLPAKFVKVEIRGIVYPPNTLTEM